MSLGTIRSRRTCRVGYFNDHIKTYSDPQLGIRPVIPTRSSQRRQPGVDPSAHRQRNCIERLINRLKQARRLATRYEKRAVNYLAMVHIGCSLR